MKVPWLPQGHTMVLPDRGEMFFRHHRHADPSAPTLLLLHGWTANADTQFFSAYEALAERYSIVAPDHRGHGRGMRARFTLEDAADDAAELVRRLDVGPVVTVGYSMGGPISLLVADRHPGLVAGIVVQATALEWRETRIDRAQWQGLKLMGFGLRSRWLPKLVQHGFVRLSRQFPDIAPWLAWMDAELRRNDPVGILEAGRALRHYDARVWAPQLGLPSGLLLTSADRLVKPRKQRALAEALDAAVREVAADHICTITHPREYSATTRELVDDVVARAFSPRLSVVPDPEADPRPAVRAVPDAR